MKGDWREEEKLRHLTGAHDPQGPKRRNSGTREIGGTIGEKSMAELAAAALADIDSNKARRKYSTDAPPPEVVIRRSRVRIVVLGALVFVLVRVGMTTLRPPPPPIPGDPVEMVAILSPAARSGVPIDPEWSAARVDTGALGERERAIRIGGLIVEMERAVARADSTAAQAHAEAITALVAEVPEAAEVAGLFAHLSDARLASSRNALAPFTRAAPMALGAWLQAARVATVTRDGGFFSSLRSRESVRILLDLPAVSPEVEAARERLDTVLRRRGRPDFAAAAGALEILQRELAN